MNNAIRNENAKVKQRLTSFFNKKIKRSDKPNTNPLEQRHSLVVMLA